jgi:formyl-CoA transferase/CoA:oxalate CoA-transferase
MTGALDGIKVLDLSQGAAGPTCAMALGDMGADVVKVEPPGGEWGRMLGPPFVGGVAAAFLGMNRNKRSIVVDLKEPDGRGVISRIAESCDVAIESFRPGVAERLGVGYDALSTVNPRIVYASISAFGQEGPWRDRPGVDGVAQAMGGIMSVTGSEDGPPVKVGVPAADMAGGMYTVQAVLAALFSRERTGRGQRVDVSLLDSLLAYQVVPLSMFLASGQAPRRLGTAAPYSAPNEAFPTNDGHVMVAAYTEKRWPALCRVLGCPDLAADPRFDTNEKRVRGRSELRGVLEPLFRARSTEDWLTLLDAADIICGPLLSYADLVREEHVIQSGALVSVPHPHMGDIRAPVFPGRFSQTPIDLSGPPPARPGEHSVAILGECGFDVLEIRKLLGSGVVADSGQAMIPAGRGGSR